MTTVYIDVYFLINFTVDLLAFHLACAFVDINRGNDPALRCHFKDGGISELTIPFVGNVCGVFKLCNLVVKQIGIFYCNFYHFEVCYL